MPPRYTHETAPAPGSTTEVAPGVFWLRVPLPFAINHINLWMLQDDVDAKGEWTAVDTGIAIEPVKEAWLQVLAGRRLRRQIVTHFHPDHLGLAGWLEQETGAPLWMTFGEYANGNLAKADLGGWSLQAMIDFYRSHGLAEEALRSVAERGNAYARSVLEIPATYRRMFDGEEFAIGGRGWRVIVGYGHSPEHASLYCAELGVLIAGDMMLPRISTNISSYASSPLANPLRLFLESIERFRALPDDTLVLPAHGLPFRGLHERIDALQEHHANRCRVLLAACREKPMTAAELIPALFDRDGFDTHQTVFAIGEAVAHVSYLEHAQALTRSVENGIFRFAPSA